MAIFHWVIFGMSLNNPVCFPPASGQIKSNSKTVGESGPNQHPMPEHASIPFRINRVIKRDNSHNIPDRIHFKIQSAVIDILITRGSQYGSIIRGNDSMFFIFTKQQFVNYFRRSHGSVKFIFSGMKGKRGSFCYGQAIE